jgi:molybdopterin-guanine dinucleotide biosynthesis protein A
VKGDLGAAGVSAAILVGGRSRRMGRNKALLTLEPSGPSVIERAVGALREVTDHIMIVGADPSAYTFLGLPWVDDRVPGTGPLGGIQAALSATRGDRVLVTACDMPFLNPILLRAMVAWPHDYDVLLPRVTELQPLHAIYTRSCLPIIEQQLARREYRLTGWFDRVNVVVIEQATVEQYDPDLRSCVNLNTPADLAAARRSAPQSNLW